MHYICLGAFLLACCATSALSLPQSSCVDEQLRLSPLKLLGKCVAPGHVEGESTNLQEPICAERLDRSRCKTSCSGLSPSLRQDLSVYSTGMAMDQPDSDGDPQTPAILTMVPLSHDNRLHDGAASAIEASGKYSGNNVIPHLSTPRRRRQRRSTPATGLQQQQHTNDMSAMRKILGGVAVAVLVMVV